MSFDVEIFLDAVFSDELAIGAAITVAVATVSIVGATLIGLGLALARDARHRPARWSSWVWVWVFRAIPTLLWLLLIWNALPQLVPAFQSSWFTPFMAAAIALSLNESAYMAEILRGGLLSVDSGQRDAGRALGMRSHRILRRIVLPQAFRVALPAAGNEYIALLKLTSLASVISLQELLTVSQQNVNTTFRFAEYYAAAACWYLAIVSVLMFVQSRIERRTTWRSRTVAMPGYQRRPAFLFKRSSA